MHTVTLLFPVFMAGVMFSTLFLPGIIEGVKRRLEDNADRADRLIDKTKKQKQKSIRQSLHFKTRLKSIRDLIKSASKQGQHKLVIVHMENCETDKEIERWLDEKRFDTYSGCDGPNSLRILWKDKSKGN